MHVIEKVKAVADGPHTDRRLFKVLKAEHREVEGLIEKIDKTGEKEGPEVEELRASLFAKVYAALLPHAKAEEEAVYPSFEQDQATRDITLEGVQEHRVIHRVLGELNEMASHGDTWMAKFKVFKENLEHHIEEEEEEMFPKAAGALSEPELASLATAYTAARDEHRRALKTDG